MVIIIERWLTRIIIIVIKGTTIAAATATGCCYYCCCYCCCCCCTTVKRLLCCFSIRQRGPKKIKRGKACSLFNLSNQNWVGCLLKLQIMYHSTVQLFCSTQQHSFKRVLCLKIYSAWSNMVWNLLCSCFLTFYLLYWNADWIGILIMVSATILCNNIPLFILNNHVVLQNSPLSKLFSSFFLI